MAVENPFKAAIAGLTAQMLVVDPRQVLRMIADAGAGAQFRVSGGAGKVDGSAAVASVLVELRRGGKLHERMMMPPWVARQSAALLRGMAFSATDPTAQHLIKDFDACADAAERVAATFPPAAKEMH